MADFAAPCLGLANKPRMQVITFDEQGMTGHPNHNATHRGVRCVCVSGRVHSTAQTLRVRMLCRQYLQQCVQGFRGSPLDCPAGLQLLTLRPVYKRLGLLSVLPATIEARLRGQYVFVHQALWRSFAAMAAHRTQVCVTSAELIKLLPMCLQSSHTRCKRELTGCSRHMVSGWLLAAACAQRCMHAGALVVAPAHIAHDADQHDDAHRGRLSRAVRLRQQAATQATGLISQEGAARHSQLATLSTR